MPKPPPVGAVVNIPGLPGRWSVWSQMSKDEGPGARSVVPADDDARATGVKFAVVRVKHADTKPFPEIELIRTDPPAKEAKKP